MTTKEANAFIKAAHAIGKYVYAPTTATIIDGGCRRVVHAKTYRGEVYVKTLYNGKYEPLAGNTLEAR
jgi:hypothetical protein